MLGVEFLARRSMSEGQGPIFCGLMFMQSDSDFKVGST
jgi:hypothetical protein